MLKVCPNCEEETEFKHGICSECGEYNAEDIKKVDANEFDSEDEFTETDWGEETERIDPNE